MNETARPAPPREAQFDGLVGPTHNYAGLSWGNVASREHGGRRSDPRAAVLQGLEKMAAVAALGVPQALLPPQERPDVATLRRLGFEGPEEHLVERAWSVDPVLAAACCSASSMWAANAATVAPSADTADGKVHVTPANLRATLHRSLEPPSTARALRRILRGPAFVHHEPLPPSDAMGDEGAANHTRLLDTEGGGVHLFVYGRRAMGDGPRPRRFPARQTLEASSAVARLHRLPERRRYFAQQHPDAIDAGVFHNDVAAVGHGTLWLFHERAFLEPRALLARLRRACGATLRSVMISEAELPLREAVRSYLFNAQIVTAADGRVVAIAPVECRESPATRAVLQRLTEGPDPAFDEVRFLDVRESMRNGGGPACLRLRIPLTEEERAQVLPTVWLDASKLEALRAWARRHYRDRLDPEDLRDPALLRESRTALDELTELLGLGGDFYSFQRTAGRTSP